MQHSCESLPLNVTPIRRWSGRSLSVGTTSEKNQDATGGQTFFDTFLNVVNIEF